MEEYELTARGEAMLPPQSRERRDIQPWQKFICGVLVLNTLISAIIGTLVAVYLARDHTSSPTTDVQAPPPPARTPTEWDASCFPLLTAAGSTARHKSPQILLRGASVYLPDYDGVTFARVDVLMKDGKITAIGEDLPADANTEIVELTEDHVVTPGLVDMHNHAGLFRYPFLKGNSDVNEETNPIFPQLRALDGFDPTDYAIPLIRAGGITTAMIMPGSGDNMGGQGFVVKFKNSTLVYDLVIQDGVTRLKWATGENPKRTFGLPKGVTPMSRIGEAWLLRKTLAATKAFMLKRQAWCKDPNSSGVGPTDLALEPLVELLLGRAKLNVHSYTQQDMLMILRLSEEFDFPVSAFHHALQAYTIPDILREANVTVATFADSWGAKPEAFDTTVRQGELLVQAGVSLAYHSDHPVTFAHDLMYDAAKAHHWGTPKAAALAAVTSVPASTIGLGDRVGKIAVGMDADIVVWDRSPFEANALAQMVYVEGILSSERQGHITHRTQFPVSATPATLKYTGSQCDTKGSSYVVTGVTVVSVGPDGTSLVNTTGASIVVSTNSTLSTVQCFGVSCTTPPGAKVFDAKNGIVIAGLIEAGTQLGKMSIQREPLTQDGPMPPAVDCSGLRAKDSIQMRTRPVDAAWAGGVSTAVVPPQGSAVIAGQGTSMLTTPAGLVFSDNELVPTLPMRHFYLGNKAKGSGLTSSISGQMKIFHASVEGLLSTGAFRVVVHTDSADVMAAVLDSLRDLQFPLERLTFIGGAEASLIAGKLAASSSSVILSPARCVPKKWEQLRCRPDNALLLHKAGVRFGIATSDVWRARNLRWEAGKLVAQGIPTSTALAAVTSRVASAFGIEKNAGSITQGQRANFVVYDSDPFSTGSKILLSATDLNVYCHPSQV